MIYVMKFQITVILLVMLSGVVAGTSYVQANGQTIAKINESGIYYYHSDHLGSTSAVTNETGEVVEEQVNLPFGQLLTGDEKHGFTGKELDETKLQYFGARYYSPLTGRFITVDPAEDGMNWYSYAGDNPLRYIDPSGKWMVETEKWNVFVVSEEGDTFQDLLLQFSGEQQDMFGEMIGEVDPDERLEEVRKSASIRCWRDACHI